jgi:hypothetical protein
MHSASMPVTRTAMIRPCLSFVLLAVMALVCSSAPAHAFSRSYLPLAAIVPQSDAIVEAHITSTLASTVKTGAVTITVDKVLKGSLPKGAATVKLLNPYHLDFQIKEGGRYLLFLKLPPGETTYEVMEYGSRNYTDKDAAEIPNAIKLAPAWAKPENGLSTLLTTESFKYRVGDEINLWVGCRNDSPSDIEIKYTDWPLATHSVWKLEVRHENSGLVTAQANPTVTAQDIDDYFSKHGRTYAVTLKPGEYHWVCIQSINTAKPGWGYKEALDFKFYPMISPGKYTVSVVGENLLKAGVLKAGSVEVTVEP